MLMDVPVTAGGEHQGLTNRGCQQAHSIDAAPTRLMGLWK